MKNELLFSELLRYWRKTFSTGKGAKPIYGNGNLEFFFVIVYIAYKCH